MPQVVIALIAVGLLVAATGDWSSPSKHERPLAAARPPAAIAVPELIVGDSVHIGPHETVRPIHQPDAFLPDMRALDRICVLYTHDEWRVATLACVAAPDGAAQ